MYSKKGMTKVGIVLGVVTGLLVFIANIPVGLGYAFAWGLASGFGIAITCKLYGWLFGEEDDDAASEV